ncbi:hypothetical protein ACHHYP_13207 [Achlya hypogyna]|uniref:Coatomer subunit zeta n=1 Tax=Achlya hypogyna TaxID=1202772 RepID=A0A1V9ZFW8_ACHHY|nr:hypothetical protein ACHHYP_13207 [Achlya hypogyna]
MMHSLLVCTDKGHVLLGRYFRATTTEEKRAFEQALYTALDWSVLQAVAPDADAQTHLVVVLKQFVVYRKLGDLVWFLAGSLEYDELILHDVLANILAVAAGHMEKRCTEALFLAHHSKILVSLDDMVHQGHLDTLDVATVLQMTKLKPYPTKA